MPSPLTLSFVSHRLMRCQKLQSNPPPISTKSSSSGPMKREFTGFTGWVVPVSLGKVRFLPPPTPHCFSLTQGIPGAQRPLPL